MDNNYLSPARRTQGRSRLVPVWLKDNWTLTVVILSFAAFGVWVMLAGEPVPPRHYVGPRVAPNYCVTRTDYNYSPSDDSVVWADPVPNP